ncbi:AAA family ATPase [Motiliproteus sp. SC1-56]|uniref:AAA family ATPase n=1 Tax=Motiliproteus sp. SC1-56 TaxID=2799565 RepID=UPI001A8F22E1|nr:AAA family ATPase [Motiliproteus sp. SC1-56]
MRITSLSLTNFRSFRSTETIPFAPVTLLFGPNSVGKSTVLMALFYIQQILGKGHCDPVRIDALGDRDIGGFGSLVNGKDLKKSIVLKVEFEVGRSIGIEYETFADWDVGSLKLLMPDVADDTRKIGVELEVGWSSVLNKAYVKRYSVWLNGEFAGQVESDDGLKQTAITAINFGHPLLKPTDHDDWVERSFEGGLPIHPSQLSQEQREEDDYEDDEDGYYTEFHSELSGMSAGLHKAPVAVNAEYACKPIGVGTFAGAVPYLGQLLFTNIDEPGQSITEDDYLNYLIVHRVLTQTFVSPLDKLLTLLEKSVCIGPLRTIPSANFVPNPHPEQAGWIDGTAAWDLLHQCDSKLNDPVNHWLSAKDCFDSGYGLASVVGKTYLETKSGKSNDLDRMRTQLTEMIRRAESDKEFDDVRYQQGIVLYDLKNHITLAPNQVGSGISQIVPVVTAAHHVTNGIVAVEQPELHIHPKFQVEVGDLFTQLDVSPSRRPTFLIETHSEHLVLRLLRRIRNTYSGEAEGDFKPVRVEDVSVLYLSNEEGEVKVHRCPISTDGDFEYDWPNGFFVEREEEIFS